MVCCMLICVLRISGSHAPKMGFKRYYKSLGSELPTLGTVKSYAERKAERLERYVVDLFVQCPPI